MKITRARLVAAERIELDEAELNPRPDQLVVRNLACGICHSERAGYRQGPPAGQTHGLGHEPVGEIVEIGGEVADPGRWSVGQRVSGYWGPGLQTYSAVDPQCAAPVPEGLPTEHAIGEVLACLITCARGWNHELGADICLVGCGFMGVLSMEAVRHTANTVIAVDLRQDRLDFAQRHGATHLVKADDDPRQRIAELTDGRMCQVVTEASGVAAGLDLAVTLTGGYRPVLNLISYYNVTMTLANLGSLANGVVVRNPHPKYAPDKYRELQLGLEWAARGIWDLDDAITHRWPLAQAHDAYDVAMHAKDGYLKGLVTL